MNSRSSPLLRSLLSLLLSHAGAAQETDATTHWDIDERDRGVCRRRLLLAPIAIQSWLTRSAALSAPRL